jgi:hypothetical protein
MPGQTGGSDVPGMVPPCRQPQPYSSPGTQIPKQWEVKKPASGNSRPVFLDGGMVIL